MTPGSALELALAEKHSTSIVTPDEQTPLLNSEIAVMGNKARANADSGNRDDAAGIPAPFDRTNGDDRGDDGKGDAAGPRRTAPQAIAHRGYKVVAPENTMLAFRAAAEAGAHAIETDLHLSRDGVVVLSHDETLKRCFGEDARVRDRDWGYLSTLRTLRKPAQPMARLLDLLEWLNTPGLENVWVMLDIKKHDDPTELVRRTAETLASVPGVRPWSERILPCCWSAQYVKLCKEYLPGYPIANVGFSTIYARALAAQVPGMAISMLRYTLATPILGQHFIRDMKRSGHPVHVWTVNEEDWMEWSVRAELDGVITDDPKLFLEVCRRMADKETRDGDRVRRRRRERLTLGSVAKQTRRFFEWALYYCSLVVVMLIFFFTRGLPRTQVRKVLES
ncbi:hypothetical protein AAE478_006597 [Parahypoxylon ruwenzoriense]